MRKIVIILTLIALLVISTACSTHLHVVGNGGQGSRTVSQTQWFALWGLISIGDTVDTNAMAGGASDYTITTEATLVDSVIGMFTGMVTISRRTVTVTR